MSHEPRVLIVTGEFPPLKGGVGDYSMLLSNQLDRLGADVTVVTTGNRSGPNQAESLGGIRVLRTIPNWGLSSWTRLVPTIQQYQPQLLHIQYQAAAYSMRPEANLLPSYLRLRFPGMRIVTTFHDLRVPYLFPRAGALRRGAIRALDALSDATVVTNQTDLEGLGGPGRSRSGGRPKRWLIPIGSNLECSPPADFDRAVWRRQIGADEGTLTVSYFGFMNDSKGVEFLIQALGLLANRGIRCRLLIVGGEVGETDPTNRGYSRQVAHLIRSKGMQDQVFWTGFVPAEQVSASLLSSDLCALPFRDGPSLRRGSLLAALAHGLPTVTTFPEHPEPLLVDGRELLMVERDNPIALADAIEYLWRDPAAAARLGAGARALALHFKWPDIAARHLKMYETLLSDDR